ncbi:MAG: sterol desaturase family protein [Pseudomonadales bacterium]|nr:sterol desaturase family protein [Pseudomonadales bacterium]
MIGFLVALLVSNAFEWFAHKYVLHGTRRSSGKGRFSPVPPLMTSHWTHHKEVRSSGDYSDDMYQSSYLQGHERIRAEINSLIVLCMLTTLVAPISLFFTLGTYYCALNYYYTHRRSHREPDWGKSKVPWHYDHHMNTNQDANWCVTKPWFDYIMGTRVISSKDLLESNPLGIKLPTKIEDVLNRLARRFSPKTFAKI